MKVISRSIDVSLDIREMRGLQTIVHSRSPWKKKRRSRENAMTDGQRYGYCCRPKKGRELDGDTHKNDEEKR